MGVTDISASIRQQCETMTRLLNQLESGTWWTGDEPDRATVDAIEVQVERIRAALAELDQLLPSEK
jgi:hypothetical protein